MPVLDFVIPEIITHVVDPVVRQVSYSVINDLGLRSFFGDDVYFLSDSEGASASSTDNRQVKTQNDRCNITYEFALNPAEMKWDVMSFRHTQAYGTMGIHRKDQVAIFNDKVADVTLYETQVPCTITMEFSMQFGSKEMAAKVVSAIINKHHQASVVKPHDIFFDYPMSANLIYALYSIYKLKHPDKDVPFMTYLKDHSSQSVSYLHNPNLPHIELVIKRAQLSALGIMEFSQTKPEAEMNEQVANRFHVNFTYSLQFARPDNLKLYFPVVVSNQLIPERLIPAGETSFHPALVGVHPDIPVTLTLQEYYKHSKYVIRYPDYDDFDPPRCPAVTFGFQHFLVMGFLLDDGDTTVIDLDTDLTPYKLHPITKEILQFHGRDIFTTNGLFNITVFANDVQIDPALITITDDLKVIVEMTNPIKRYHLVLFEAMDLNHVDPRYWTLLEKYPDYFGIQILKNLRDLIKKGVNISDAFKRGEMIHIPLRVMNAEIIIPNRNEE